MATNNERATALSSSGQTDSQPQASGNEDNAITHSQGSTGQENNAHELQTSLDDGGNNVASTQNSGTYYSSNSGSHESSQFLQNSGSASQGADGSSSSPDGNGASSQAADVGSEQDAVREPLRQHYNDSPPPPYPGPLPPPYDQPAPPYPGPPQSQHYQTTDKGQQYQQYYQPSTHGAQRSHQRVVTTQPSSSDEYGMLGGLMGSQDSSRPNNWLALSIVTCLCFSPICGLFAICFSLMSHTAYTAGDVERAKRNANFAVATSFLGISLSILAAILYFYAQR